MGNHAAQQGDEQEPLGRKRVILLPLGGFGGDGIINEVGNQPNNVAQRPRNANIGGAAPEREGDGHGRAHAHPQSDKQIAVEFALGYPQPAEAMIKHGQVEPLPRQKAKQPCDNQRVPCFVVGAVG